MRSYVVDLGVRAARKRKGVVKVHNGADDSDSDAPIALSSSSR